MHAQANSPAPTHAAPAVLVVAGAWILSYFVARYLLDTWPQAQQWEFAIVSLPVCAFFWLVWAVQRGIRGADELERRIHLEALAMAFLTTMLAMMGLGLLEETPRGVIALPWRHLWLALLPLYGVCYAIAAWHYR